MRSIDVSTLEKLGVYMQERELVMEGGYGIDKLLRKTFGENNDPQWWVRLTKHRVVVSLSTGVSLLQAIERAVASFETR